MSTIEPSAGATSATSGSKILDDNDEEEEQKDVETKQVQLHLKEFATKFKPQNMLLSVNPILLNNENEAINEAKLQKLREQMEDPANYLNMTLDLTIKDDIKDKVYKIKNNICKALLSEDISIKTEIR